MTDGNATVNVIIHLFQSKNVIVHGEENSSPLIFFSLLDSAVNSHIYGGGNITC